MPDKPVKSESRRDEVDLETQFILRLPEDHSNKVRKPSKSKFQIF